MQVEIKKEMVGVLQARFCISPSDMALLGRCDPLEPSFYQGVCCLPLPLGKSRCKYTLTCGLTMSVTCERDSIFMTGVKNEKYSVIKWLISTGCE